MKKILSLVTAAALILIGAAPVRADVTTVPADGNFTEWSSWTESYVAIGVTGSLTEGGTYTVTGTGNGCPSAHPNFPSFSNRYARYNGMIVDPAPGNPWLASAPDWGSANSSAPIGFNISLTATAGPAGTSKYYVASQICAWDDSISARGVEYRSSIIKVTFESAVGNPSNFSVFPQAGGTAFATWGVANGATSYTVTAYPLGATCTTANNYCVISGLTPGDTYTFSVVATDGTSSSSARAATFGPVVLREPVTVGVGLNGGTWRVGETVSAQYVVQGSNSTPTITWYRCNGVVGAMPAPPAPGDCTSVGSGASYALTAGDVGKYVTANVFVNNTDPQGQMTASSFNAVLSSGVVAPAPVADPGGKPTVVNIPNPIVSVAGGTEVTITGTGLAGVTVVTIGGLPAIVVSKTDTTVVVQVPVSTKTGLADLTITNDKGSVTSKSAIIYTTNPVIKITKTKTITGFKAGQKVLTTAQKTAVKTLITANPTLNTLSCAAKTVGVASNKTELAKAKTLATASCAYAKTLKKTLIVSSSASQTLPKSKASRTVALTLKN